jgi:phosphorylcholine metabolism protein LicD
LASKSSKKSRIVRSVCRRFGKSTVAYYNERKRKSQRRVDEKVVVRLRIFEREKIQETVEVDFHGLKVQMLKEWEYYLSNLYGDWHKYVIGAAIHGGLVIDVDKPYTEYF